MNRSIRRAGAALGAALLVIALVGRAGLRLRRPDRAERRGQPAPDDDARRLPRRRGALRHGVPVRRRRRGVRLADATPRDPVEGREGRRLDAPAADPGDRAAARRSTPSAAAARRGDSAEELMKVRIDALDVTVLRGGAGDGRRVGDGARLPAPARRARGARLLRRALARSSSPPCSTPMRPPSAARRSATGRRSTSRSRPTTRGSRCASWPSARPARSGSRPTSTC